jgi:uncharacterized membrane protein
VLRLTRPRSSCTLLLNLFAIVLTAVILGDER